MTTTTGPDQVPDYLAGLRLDGRVLVVLGGGQGIGRQTAHALAQAGAAVVVVDADAARAEAVAHEIRAAHGAGRAVVRAADVTDAVAMAELADTAAADLGGVVHGVVDIVGVARYGSLLELTDEDWSHGQAIVLRHAWLALKHFAPAMPAGGSFTFVGSVSGVASAPDHGAYGAFKAGLASLVRTAAVELGPRGIRVNAVAPGVIRTPRMADRLGPGALARLAAAAPLGRTGAPADIAASLLFLSSDLGSFVSGQTLVVDGGATATSPYSRP